MSSGDIRIKNPEDIKNLMLCRFNPVLTDIISWVAKHYGIEIVETFREKKYYGDLHSDMPVREIDFTSNSNPDLLLKAINVRWQEPSSKKPIAILKENTFHVRTSPKTRLRRYQ